MREEVKNEVKYETPQLVGQPLSQGTASVILNITEIGRDNRVNVLVKGMAPAKDGVEVSLTAFVNIHLGRDSHPFFLKREIRLMKSSKEEC